MAQFMLLIYGDPADAPGPDEQAGAARGVDELHELAACVRRDGLRRPAGGRRQATTLRSRDGELQRTDGAAAETKEMLGGYYVVEVPISPRREAMAAKMPNIEYGSVEVRPVVVFPDA